MAATPGTLLERFRSLRASLLPGALCALCGVLQAGPVVHTWRSAEDLSERLTSQPETRFEFGEPGNRCVIRVDETIRHQPVLGLGASLDHSTCYNLNLLPPGPREQALGSLVHPETGIGMSLMRLCIGTPDFTASPWYTYDDMPVGEEDPKLERFSIQKDRAYVLPIIQLARRLNPALKFFASPWSPPGWMKTRDRICGGSIDPVHFGHYAEYLARFVEAYRVEGIEIDALTVQNEPEYAPDTYPTCRWTAAQQRDFIRDHLGPLFRSRGIATRIWCYDHNFNHPGFPETILRDPGAAQYVDGTAFHLYEGKPAAMGKLQRRFPAKAVYFTEGSTYGAAGAAQIMDYFLNGSRTYNAWVTLMDQQMQPNPGPHACDPTCIVLNRDTLTLDYRFDYYLYGQFTKFIRPGAVRVYASGPSKAPAHVAFQNPNGSLVLVAANPADAARSFAVGWDGQVFTASLDPKTVATFVWSP